MRILITGAKGQLGTELQEILATGRSEIGPVPEAYRGAETTCVDLDSLDASDEGAVRAFEAGLAEPFDLILNCAAMTNVDACETEPEAALLGNAVGPRNMAALAARQGAKLVHVSTDYVFAGNASAPYTEWDLPAPATVYGKSKLLGEQYALAQCPRTFIVRTAWLYGKQGNNFVKTIFGLASQRDEITVVYDQVGNPTNAGDLAHHLLLIALTEEYGIYHCTGNGICSWHEFAEEIVKLAGLPCVVKPVTTEEFPRPAPRPAYSAMDHLMLRATVGDGMRMWQEALAAYMPHLK
ncbi:MAG: dTDP-4-dehydrorhamnose reductase [Clostridiales Family XIII bacterium]|jgi:dTDP-4-dehydrorhamnose reductase|nr:dTDP-4-dehydrorhamnose reductase [Clostridiales Family XIII bacterium]